MTSTRGLQRWSTGTWVGSLLQWQGYISKGSLGLAGAACTSCQSAKGVLKPATEFQKKQRAGTYLVEREHSRHGLSKRLPREGGKAGDSLLQIARGKDLPPSYHPHEGVQLTQIYPSLEASCKCCLGASLTICPHPVAGMPPSPVTCVELKLKGQEWATELGEDCYILDSWSGFSTRNLDSSHVDSFCFKIIYKKTLKIVEMPSFNTCMAQDFSFLGNTLTV